MNTNNEFPLPAPTVYTAPFWNACQESRLEVPACNACGDLFFPGGPVCPHCLSYDLGTRELSGLGRVFSFVVYRRTYHPAIPAPYVVALIELDEGVRLISNVVDCSADTISIGMEVEVIFKLQSGFALPYFKPREHRESIHHE